MFLIFVSYIHHWTFSEQIQLDEYFDYFELIFMIIESADYNFL